MRCDADDRQALEQLCRYITRPALANERVQTNVAGQVVLKLKTPWRDDTTHLVMSPLEFMQLSVEWPVCGRQIRWFYICSGSATTCRNADRDARELKFTLRIQNSGVHRLMVSASSGCSHRHPRRKEQSCGTRAATTAPTAPRRSLARRRVGPR